MKTLLYRDILGDNPRKHEVSIEETIDQRNTKVSKRRTCKYFVKDCFSSPDKEKLRKWIAAKQAFPPRKDCHVIRVSDCGSGEEKIVCKVLGDFFVVWCNTAYEIVYLNEVKLSINDGKRRK